ncbi:hypothetical protein HAX54_052099 [Datura stramonium]|uniref:Uncharacterized protein n=1 Tax=Datura stramonium TaxID=4076 RepID=A0ABS8SZ66_DATST|nr:hypothetical protein [Datura stramonium]
MHRLSTLKEAPIIAPQHVVQPVGRVEAPAMYSNGTNSSGVRHHMIDLIMLYMDYFGVISGMDKMTPFHVTLDFHAKVMKFGLLGELCLECKVHDTEHRVLCLIMV